jgi:hypothetical protein
MWRGVPSDAAGEDRLECDALLNRRPLVYMQNPGPWRSGLVVAVVEADCQRHAGEIDAVGIAIVDHPRKDPFALPMSRSPPGAPLIRRQGHIASQLHDSK